MRREVTPHAHGRGFGAVRFPDLNAAASRRGANKAGGTNFAEGHLWPNEPIPFRGRVVLRPAWMIVSRRPTPAHGRFCQLWGMLRGLFKKMAARIRYPGIGPAPEATPWGSRLRGPLAVRRYLSPGQGINHPAPEDDLSHGQKKWGGARATTPTTRHMPTFTFLRSLISRLLFTRRPNLLTHAHPFDFKAQVTRYTNFYRLDIKRTPKCCVVQGEGVRSGLLFQDFHGRQRWLVGKRHHQAFTLKLNQQIFFFKIQQLNDKVGRDKKSKLWPFPSQWLSCRVLQKGKKDISEFFFISFSAPNHSL